MSEGALPPPVSARRTVALSFTFAGRASRSELVSYVLAAAFATLLVSFATALFLDYELRSLVRYGLAIALAIPVPALLVRRLHDLNRSGQLAWLALPAVLHWATRTAISASSGIEGRIAFDKWTWPIDWIVILANLALVILIALPGTPGSNRFGPDPRRGSGELLQHPADRFDPGA